MTDEAQPSLEVQEAVAKTAALVRCAHCLLTNGLPPKWCPAVEKVCPFHPESE